METRALHGNEYIDLGEVYNSLGDQLNTPLESSVAQEPFDFDLLSGEIDWQAAFDAAAHDIVAEAHLQATKDDELLQKLDNLFDMAEENAEFIELREVIGSVGGMCCAHSSETSTAHGQAADIRKKQEEEKKKKIEAIRREESKKKKIAKVSWIDFFFPPKTKPAPRQW